MYLYQCKEIYFPPVPCLIICLLLYLSTDVIQGEHFLFYYLFIICIYLNSTVLLWSPSFVYQTTNLGYIYMYVLELPSDDYDSFSVGYRQENSLHPAITQASLLVNEIGVVLKVATQWIYSILYVPSCRPINMKTTTK